MIIDTLSLTNSLPILKAGRAARAAAGGTVNFLFEANSNGVTIVSSNLVSETVCGIEASDVKPGSAAVPPQFAEIIERCGKGPIDLKMTEKRATVTVGAMKAKLPLMPADSFPRLEIGKVVASFTINAAALGHLLAQTTQFAPINDTRPVLNGVLLVLAKGRMNCVATNGHVMSIASTAADIVVDEPSQHILPIAGVRQLMRLVDCAKEVTLDVADNGLTFKAGSTELKMKPIVGRYPNWSNLIRNRPEFTVSIQRAQLSGILDRAKIFAEGKAPTAKFELGASALKVTVNSAANGDFNDVIAVENYSETGAKVFHANLEYMALATASVNDETIRLSYSADDDSQVWFRKSQADDYIVVTSPVRA